MPEGVDNSSLSQSQRAGLDAGEKLFNGMFDTVAVSLGKNYELLQQAFVAKHGETLLPPPSSFQSDEEYRIFIRGLTTKVLENNSPLATDIREKYKAIKKPEDPAEIPTLDDLYKSQRAVTKAVTDNTGDFEFLGGSTVLNAIVALFQWIFSGFEGGFEGLKGMIANRAIGNTTSDFEANLQSEGVSPELTKILVPKLEQAAKERAQMATEGEKPPTINELTRPKVVVAPYKATEVKEGAPVRDSFVAHYSGLAERITNTAMGKWLPETFVSNVSSSAGEVIDGLKDKKISPEDMDRQVLLAAIPKMEKSFPAEHRQNVAAAKDALANAQSVPDAIAALPDGDPKLLLSALNLELANKDRVADFVGLMQKVGLADEQQAKASRDSFAKASGMKVNWQDKVSRQVDEIVATNADTFSAASLRINIDAAVKEKAGMWDNGATRAISGFANMVGLGGTTSGLRPPTDQERNGVASFLSEQLPALIKEKTKAAIMATAKNGGMPDANKFDPDALQKDIRIALDEKLKNDKTVPDFWKNDTNRTAILDAVSKELTPALDNAKKEMQTQLNGGKVAMGPDYGRMLKDGPQESKPLVATNGFVSPARTPLVKPEDNFFAKQGANPSLPA